ncbi:MAG: peptidylprolyl isomerase [Curvibacter lanceolatus]|jgi:peptidyl-prolyl cis-trans isomerase C|uniref:peptidylprolyl isomerase n=1 Tax=Curvibacter lanceolatus TaxID=86182 RepID=UPI00035F8F39|nr:peptidylprolyl isomerase [Curvibacter lanceolatus]MBV5291879.1 peptidylprolyl isomerase [Curvibacter lanceolatus]
MTPNPIRPTPTQATLSVAGQRLDEDRSDLSEGERHQRARLALLRLAAIHDGLLPDSDPAPHDGVLSEAAADAIDLWLAQHLQVPEPDETACRRYHAAHRARYAVGERVQARHILFAVTPGTDVKALRGRAEQALLSLRAEPQRFAEQAAALSNCPSGAQGGELGWLGEADCAPELARELLGQDADRAHVGVLPRLVHSRFGLHVVEVLAREPGQHPEFEQVRNAVAQAMRQSAWITALRQQLLVLAARWPVQGVALEQAESPLMQ